MDAHFLFKLANGHTVALTQRAVLFHDELRNDEQRHAFDAVWPAGDLRQNKVNDVFRHVVITGRDKDFLARDLVAAVFLRNRLRAHQTQIRATMRFGQVHGAGPLAGGHLRQKCLLLLVRTVEIDGRIGTMGQALVHVERHVRRHKRFLRGCVHQVGQALPTIFRVTIQRGPAAFFHDLERFFKAVRRAHHAVFQHATLLVADCVQRHQHFRGHLARFLDHRAGKVAVQLFVAGDILLGRVQNVVQDELHVFHRCGIARHVGLPKMRCGLIQPRVLSDPLTRASSRPNASVP